MKEEPPCQLSIWTQEEIEALSESQAFFPRPQQRHLFELTLQLSDTQRDRSPDCELSMMGSKKSKGSSRRGSARMVTVSVGDAGRPVGESAVSAKYLDADVEHARQLRSEGYSWRKISLMLEIPVRTIRNFVDGSRRAVTVVGWKKVKRWVNEN